MMRWISYLFACLVVEVLAIFLAPVLPLFARLKYGPWENASGQALGHRLPSWLAWFDTPDNALEGDSNWQASHIWPSSHWSMAGWLLRNRAYGFKWSVLSAPNNMLRIVEGDKLINYHTSRFGELRITMGDYWQWKRIGKLGNTGYGYMLNFGWLLDDTSQERALFLFSPRIVRVK